MAFCRLVFPLLVLSVVSCYASKVPVYMWGLMTKNQIHANPLATIPDSEFKSILDRGLMNDPLTLVFVEETLSVEDFSRKDANGETYFPYLFNELSEAVYLPSVEHPVHVLKDIAKKSKATVDLSGILPEDIPAEYSAKGNFIFIDLKDALYDETRPDLLRRHDEFMQKTVANMQKYHSEVVGIYTAYYPSWSVAASHSRTRRAAEPNTLDGLGLYAQSITLVSSNETATLSTITGHRSEFNADNMTTKLEYENNTSITLNFNKKAGYWFFNSVAVTVGSLTETLEPVGDEVYALEGFAYRCGQDVSFNTVNDTKDYTLTFKNLKVQPFFETTNGSITFGESYNCVGYFSPAILASLLVVFVLLAITFYGIMMMLDIRTMDRFDDPKGKTITINASE